MLQARFWPKAAAACGVRAVSPAFLSRSFALLYIRIYKNYVGISFDASKKERNIELRGISFDLAAEFEWHDSLIVEDVRKDDGEPRYQALGRIGARLYMLVFTPRGRKAHVISLRKANEREVKRYEAQA